MSGIDISSSLHDTDFKKDKRFNRSHNRYDDTPNLKLESARYINNNIEFSIRNRGRGAVEIIDVAFFKLYRHPIVEKSSITVIPKLITREVYKIVKAMEIIGSVIPRKCIIPSGDVSNFRAVLDNDEFKTGNKYIVRVLARAKGYAEELYFLLEASNNSTLESRNVFTRSQLDEYIKYLASE